MKVVTYNIERKKHLARAVDFIRAQLDVGAVVCLQEVLEGMMPELQREVDARGVFLATCNNISVGIEDKQGIAIFTRHEDIAYEEICYLGDMAELPIQHEKDFAMRGVMIVATVKEGGKVYRIANTHFIWSPDGQADDRQREGVKNMLKACAHYREIILVGDFNAPRGREIYDYIASVYRDNMPIELKTTIDNDLHRCEHELHLVVDSIFTSSGYEVLEIDIVSGVSDHFAILAKIA